MNIEEICERKQQELLDKYFGNLTYEAAIAQPETICEYTQDLPLKIEEEYRSFLEELWPQYAPEDMKGQPLVLEEQRLRHLITDDDREMIDTAHKNAVTRTLWERITNTNHKDVTYYKGILREYTKELLLVMRLDFLEEITGNHINSKAFED